MGYVSLVPLVDVISGNATVRTEGYAILQKRSICIAG